MKNEQRLIISGLHLEDGDHLIPSPHPGLFPQAVEGEIQSSPFGRGLR